VHHGLFVDDNGLLVVHQDLEKSPQALRKYSPQRWLVILDKLAQPS
jgi:hypothetical protein